MTKTSNYQLNQWEKTDRIMMEDFNADNLKLEAALEEKVARRLLWETELTEETLSVTLDVTGIDWGAWQAVLIQAIPGETGRDALLRVIPTAVNNYSSSYFDLLSATHTEISNGLGRGSVRQPTSLYLLTGRSAGMPIRAVTLSYNYLTLGKNSDTFENLTKIAFQGEDSRYPYPVGSKFQIWGIQ